MPRMLTSKHLADLRSACENKIQPDVYVSAVTIQTETLLALLDRCVDDMEWKSLPDV